MRISDIKDTMRAKEPLTIYFSNISLIMVIISVLQVLMVVIILVIKTELVVMIDYCNDMSDHS